MKSRATNLTENTELLSQVASLLIEVASYPDKRVSLIVPIGEFAKEPVHTEGKTQVAFAMV
jgi:hypothetical protein